jgi:membrane protein EpsK
MAELLRLSKASVRVLSLLMAVPISVLCVFSSSLLRFWLGPSFTKLAPLMVIMLCHLVITVGVMPVFSIQVAMNKVRVPALVTLLSGVVTLVLAIAFVRYLNWGIYGVAIAVAIVLPARTAGFSAVYAAIILREPWHTFLKPCLSAIGLSIGVMLLGYTLNRYGASASLLHVVLLCLVLGAVGLAAAWITLPRSDRRVMVALMPGRLGMMAERLNLV